MEVWGTEIFYKDGRVERTSDRFEGSNAKERAEWTANRENDLGIPGYGARAVRLESDQ